MYGDAVTIQLAEAPAAAQVGAMVSACDGVLGTGKCRLASARGAASSARFQATVRVDGARLVVVVMQRKQRTGAERPLTFREGDSLQERWEAAGLTIAAIVAGEPAEPAEPSTATPAAAPRGPRWPFFGELTLVGGPGLGGGAVRGGAQLFAGWRVSEWPLGPVVGLRHERTGGGDLEVATSSGVLGLAGPIPGMPAGWFLEPRLTVGLDAVHVAATRGASTESALRLRAVGRLGLVAGLRMADGRVSVVAGLEGAAHGSDVAVEVAGARVATIPALSGAVLLGVRVSF